MSFFTFTRTNAPATPVTNKVTVFVDTADKRVKQIDDTGAISNLTEDGLKAQNTLMNGGFRIQQRVATASTLIPALSTTTRAGQVSDRWAVTTSVASGLNWAQIDSSGATETGLLARYYGSIISSTAGKKVMLSQFVINSNMAHLRGQKVRVSFKHNQKAGLAQTFKIGLIALGTLGTVDVSPAFLTGAWSAVTGTDPVWGTNLTAITPDASPTGENGTITGSYLNVTSTVAIWTRSSVTFTVPTGAKNLVAVFFSNATGGITDNISISEAQLTQGANIIDFVDVPLSFELVRCQRFFSKSFPLTVVPAASLAVATAGNGETGIIGKAAATALAVVIRIIFPIRMWRTPTLTLFTPVGAGAVPFRINGTTPAVQTAAATTGLLDMGAVVTATGDLNGAVGDLVGVHYTAEAEFIT